MPTIIYPNKQELNNFLLQQPRSEFLQSWQWGELQQRLGNKILRIGLSQSGRLAAAATLIKKKLLLGQNYFYAPRGPIIANPKDKGLWQALNQELIKIAKKQQIIFWRLEPASLPSAGLLWQKTIPIQPPKTLILDLTKSKDELLAAMHSKMRYNIRLAVRKGVEIRAGNKNEFNLFWQLLTATSVRDRFRRHPKSYYQKMLASANEEIKTKDNLYIKLFFAQYQNKVIASGIFAFFGNTVTYLHGASANYNRNLMAPHLLQWELIVLAKKLGYHYYDFYGIDKEKWPGVTRFKRGFGGQVIKYPGTFDLIFQPGWYRLYKTARQARRLGR